MLANGVAFGRGHARLGWAVLTSGLALALGCLEATSSADLDGGAFGASDRQPVSDGATVEAAPSPDRGNAFPGLPGCNLHFTNSTANITAPEVPMADACPGERTDDGMGHAFLDFQPGDVQAGVIRTFNIWQFETQAPAGTVLRIENGFDELASRGVSVRYLEIDGSRSRVWRADRGTVTLTSTRDEAYTLTLAGVHLVPDAQGVGINLASGDFEVDGTVTSVLP